MAQSDKDYLGAIAVQRSDLSWFTVPYTGEDLKRGARATRQAKNRLRERVLFIDHEKVHSVLGQMLMEAHHAGKHTKAREIAAALCVNMTAWHHETVRFIIADTHCPEDDCADDSHLACCRRCEAATVDAFIGCFSQSGQLGSEQIKSV